MKHLLNDISQEEKNRILGQHSGGKKVTIENFNELVNKKLGEVKPYLIKEEVIDGWENIFNKLKSVGSPKVIDFDTYSTNPVRLQSLNWGTTKSGSGNYGMSIVNDSNEMKLFSDDKELQEDLHQWWKDKGYKVESISVQFDYSDGNRFFNDMKDFIESYPPEK